jgi:hypothetical protein
MRDRYELRAIQMQKMINPQVIDSYRDKEPHFPVLSKFGQRRFSLYKQ